MSFCRHVFSNRLAPEAALSAEERRGALPHPAQLPEALLRRAVGDAAQRLVQPGKLGRPAGSFGSFMLANSAVPTKTVVEHVAHIYTPASSPPSFI